MATDRFYRLPAEKRERIIRAAIKEFSRVPYEKASINKIIKEAGIPRGSFYQYFADKQDLQVFLVEDFISQRQKEIYDFMQKNKGDIFDFFMELYQRGVNYIQDEENRSLCRNAMLAIQNDKSRWMIKGDKCKEQKAEILRFYEHFKNTCYPETNVETIQSLSGLLFCVFRDHFVRLMVCESDWEKEKEEFRLHLSIIKTGFLQMTASIKETKNA